MDLYIEGLSDIKSTISENITSEDEGASRECANKEGIDWATVYVNRAATYINALEPTQKQRMLMLFDQKVGRGVKIGRMFMEAMVRRTINNKPQYF
jgi:hypothetical protein